MNALFEKLNQGCNENDEILALANARAEAEYAYGSRLKDIPITLAPRKDGFGKDDGSTLKKSYEGIVSEMGEEGDHHVQIAENIRKQVIQPFSQWADKHRQRVEYSQNFLKAGVKQYEKDEQEAQRAQYRYFNKCRLYDAKREEEAQKLLAEGADPQSLERESSLSSVKSSATSLSTNPTVSRASTIESSNTETDKAEPKAAEEDFEDEVELADIAYSKAMLKELLHKMLSEIPQTSIKVPIIGVYENVSIGSDIVDWLMHNQTSNSVALAEKFGQDLIQNGFLRLVGSVGSKFANSSVFKYQWKRKAFITAGIEEEKPTQKNDLITTMAEDYLPGALSSYLNSSSNPNETQVQRLEREVQLLDKKAREAVEKCDETRTALEEQIIEHLNFMEQCERDRLKAIKVVLLDFSGAISNKFAGIKSTIDKYLLYQESIVPERDLRFLIELNKTGSFSPKPVVYDNYYNPSEGWTFGGELELRARGDGKRMPLIVSSILRYLDELYPKLDDDGLRLAVWTVDVPLKETHKLRKELNNGGPISTEIFDKYRPPVVGSVLKLYLLELPDSLVPHRFYDTIKELYKMNSSSENPKAKIMALISIFKQIKFSSIATMDGICMHLDRLMTIADVSEEYRVNIGQQFGPLFLRPKVQTSVTMADRHPYLLVRDLIEHRKDIFKELKRQASMGGSRRSSARRSGSTSSLPGFADAASQQANVNLQRNSSFMESSESKFHFTPIAKGKGKTESSTTSSSGSERQNSISGADSAIPEVPTSPARNNVSLTDKVPTGIPSGAEVIEVDDDDDIQEVPPPPSK